MNKIWSTPAVKLPKMADIIDVVPTSATDDINGVLMSLMAIVNREQPRIGVAPDFKTAEFDTLGIKYNKCDIWQVLDKYKKYLNQVILYNASIKYGQDTFYDHTMLLAATHAGLTDSIIATREVYNSLIAHGYELTIVADYTNKFIPPIDINKSNTVSDVDRQASEHRLQVYSYMYKAFKDHKFLNKRIVVSQNPELKSKLFDYAMLARAAIIYLKNDKDKYPKERELVDLFLSNTIKGASVYMGWGSDDEGPFVSAASENGLYTWPSDHSANLSLYAAKSKNIDVPKLRATNIDRFIDDNGDILPYVYVAIGVSDGDNLQYIGGYMFELWKQAHVRTDLPPLSWSFSPSCHEVAPILHNYYFNTIRPQDSFFTGPSGAGYFYPKKLYQDKELHNAMLSIYDTTNQLLNKTGISVISTWYLAVGDPEIPDEYKTMIAKRISNAKGILFQRIDKRADIIDNVLFGYWDDPYSDNPDNVWFKKVQEAWLSYVDDYAKKPKFVNIQTVNWTKNLFDLISNVRACSDELVATIDGKDLGGINNIKYITIDEWVELKKYEK